MYQPSNIPAVIWALLVAAAGLVVLTVVAPAKRRPAVPPPTVFTRPGQAPPWARLDPAAVMRVGGLPPALEPRALSPAWFRDPGDVDVCGFDLDLDVAPAFELHLIQSRSGELSPALSTLDLLFLAWTSHQYQINPHFLLGIMHAESAGDCSAVSVAGAQGCFQITDSAGAQQLTASYPERMADWYWARRRLTRLSGKPWPPEGQAQDYYPADLFVDPGEQFRDRPGGVDGVEAQRARRQRQLRRLVDPVATEIRSETHGDVSVSSVASFGFGAIGAGLYFHWAGRLLLAQDALQEEIRAAFGAPGRKAHWMAASYNQGGPRSVRLLARRGEAFVDGLSEDVATYTRRVTSACLDLEQGTPLPERQISWEVFSDFLQELRWTYSGVPIDWEGLRGTLQGAVFSAGPVEIHQIPRLFDEMVRLQPALAPEEPRLDFTLGWEG